MLDKVSVVLRKEYIRKLYLIYVVLTVNKVSVVLRIGIRLVL